jgi:hypothetical protein
VYLIALSGVTYLLFIGCGGSVSPLGPSGPIQPGCSIGVTSAPATQNEWTWTSGANIANQAGTHGGLGVAAPTNTSAGTLKVLMARKSLLEQLVCARR